MCVGLIFFFFFFFWGGGGDVESVLVGPVGGKDMG